MDKQQLIREKTEQLKNQSSGGIAQVSLPDIAMMNMIGKFGKFLKNFSGDKIDDASIRSQIEETKKDATAQDIYVKFLDKMATYQFSDGPTVLRELCQNGIDSYDHNDVRRNVLFEIGEEGGSTVLTVKDSGVGMNLTEIVEYLLVPYKSQKRNDTTKIGEHGVGWFSVIGISDAVQVTSRKKGSKEEAVALVHKNGNLEAVLSKRKYEPGTSGTEVKAFLKKDDSSNSYGINNENLERLLCKFVGYVDPSRAQIIFKDRTVNTLPSQYREARQIDVKIGSTKSPLKFSFSKRALKGNFGDNRFVDRDQNLQQIVYTQSGLHVKYGPNPFAEGTMQKRFFDDLTKQGVDFWVELPKNVGLTIGRNDIVPEHSNDILEASYESFKKLFLDAIVSDEELVYHPTSTLAKGLADIFDERYKDYITAKMRGEYSLKRRFASAVMPGVRKAVKSVYNAGKFCVTAPFKLAYYTVLVPASVVGGAVKSVYEQRKNIPKAIGAAALAAAICYGTYSLGSVGYSSLKEHAQAVKQERIQKQALEEIAKKEQDAAKLKELSKRYSAPIQEKYEKIEAVAENKTPAEIKKPIAATENTKDDAVVISDTISKEPKPEIRQTYFPPISPIPEIAESKPTEAKPETKLEKIAESAAILPVKTEDTQEKLDIPPVIPVPETAKDEPTETKPEQISSYMPLVPSWTDETKPRPITKPDTKLEEIAKSTKLKPEVAKETHTPYIPKPTVSTIPEPVKTENKNIEMEVVYEPSQPVHVPQKPTPQTAEEQKHGLTDIVSSYFSSVKNSRFFSEEYSSARSNTLFGAAAALGLLGLGYAIKRNPKKVVKGLGKVLLSPVYVPLMIVQGIEHVLKQSWDLYQKSVSATVDIENIKRQKIELRKQEIIAKYKSSLKIDEFKRDIMSKQMLRAVIYSPKKKGERIFSSDMEGDGFGYLSGEEKRISVDDIISFYVHDKLRFKKDNKRKFLEDGDCFVNDENDMIKRVIDNLAPLKAKIEQQYNPIVLEEHIRTVKECIGSTLRFAYLISGAGVLHILASACYKNIKNPYENSEFYKPIKKFFDSGGLEDIVHGTADLGLKTLKHTCLLPVYAAQAIGYTAYGLGKGIFYYSPKYLFKGTVWTGKNIAWPVLKGVSYHLPRYALKGAAWTGKKVLWPAIKYPALGVGYTVYGLAKGIFYYTPKYTAKGAAWTGKKVLWPATKYSAIGLGGIAYGLAYGLTKGLFYHVPKFGAELIYWGADELKTYINENAAERQVRIIKKKEEKELENKKILEETAKKREANLVLRRQKDAERARKEEAWRQRGGLTGILTDKTSAVYENLASGMKFFYDALRLVMGKIFYGDYDGPIYTGEVSEGDLARIMHHVNVGQNYSLFMAAVKRADSLMSNALGTDRLNIIYDYKPIDRSSDQVIGIQRSSHKGDALLINMCERQVNNFIMYLNTNGDASRFYYTIFESMLEHKTHQHLKKWGSAKDAEIYTAIEENRQRVVDHMLSRDPTLEAYLSRAIQENRANGQLKDYVAPQDIVRMSCLRLLGLKEKRREYEYDILMQKEKSMKKL